MRSAPTRVAVIGAGIAGVTCARRLARAGNAVQLFEKSRGFGGRLATRRVEWAAENGIALNSSFDHGAPTFTARSPEFARFAEDAQRNGWLARWSPEIAPESREVLDGLPLWVPVPDMPSLCRRLLDDVPVRLSCRVDALRRDNHGWRIEHEGVTVADGFGQVVLALPLPQAVPLLQAHRADWAQQSRELPMLPCWTLMGVADCGDPAPTWDLALPTRGPLSWIGRNESKLGRDALRGLAHWVLHATAPWSQAHLEASAGEAQALLQQALIDWLGHPLRWRHVLVHRWRYASVPSANSMVSSHCWWDASMGLGVCGDALGGAGVEGAWFSARALAAVILESADVRALQ